MKKRYIATLALVMLLAYASPYAVSLAKPLLLSDSADEPAYSAETKAEVTLEQGDTVLFGSYLGEPILWEACKIEDGKVLLISKYVICFKAFDAGGADEKYHPAEDTQKYGSADWESSTLRQWLNSYEETVSYSHSTPDEGINAYADEPGFLHEQNFSAEQRALISDEGVFLPSKSELKELFKTGERKKTCTFAALAADESPYITTKNKAVWYWTRTALGTNNISVVAVTSAGAFYKTIACDSATGVCPALYLKTNSVWVSGGTGSAAEPYIILGGGDAE